MHTKQYDPSKVFIVYKDPEFEPDEEDLKRLWLDEKALMDKISQPVDTLPENGTYTTSTDIDLELDHIYFEDGELEANPERVLFTYLGNDDEEFVIDAATAVSDEICEDDEGPYTITNVEYILDY